MRKGYIAALVEDESNAVEGVSMITVLTAGDLVLKGTQAGAAAITLVVTAGMQLYVPDAFYFMTASTATIAAFG